MTDTGNHPRSPLSPPSASSADTSKANHSAAFHNSPQTGSRLGSAPLEPTPAFIRVVIPAYRAKRLIRDAVLAVLESQGPLSLEVVVVDDGGNNDLPQLLSGLPVAIISTGGSGSAAVARNCGAQGFTGDFLAFIDSDVLVDSHCIEKLIAPLRSHTAEATVGNYSRNVRGLPFAARYKQLYISKIYQRRAGYLQNEFWTAIGAIDAAVFQTLAGFDPRFKGAGGEDTDLGRRLTEHGFRVLAVPEALGDHRHLLSLPQLLQNDWRKGLLAMENHFESDGSLSHNRHATRRDMLAVASATLGIVALLTAPFAAVAMHPAIIVSLLAVLYLSTRADVLRVFASQGISFVIPAAGLMFLLDATRSACFITGMYRRFLPGGKGPVTRRAEADISLRLDDPIPDEEYLHSHLSI